MWHCVQRLGLAIETPDDTELFAGRRKATASAGRVSGGLLGPGVLYADCLHSLPGYVCWQPRVEDPPRSISWLVT